MKNIRDTDEFPLPSGCRFRIWTRAELEVGDVRIAFEGRHAGLMRELLRNRGRRVASSLLWSAMLEDGESPSGISIEHAVQSEINQIRYALGARGILLSIDDSEPDRGFMLSDVMRIAGQSRPTLAGARKHKSRKTMTAPTPQGSSMETNRDQIQTAHRSENREIGRSLEATK
jgi:DNA-binding winged helix-turn-helix (wHTH) protein